MRKWRGVRASLPRFHLRIEDEEKMGSPWDAGTALRWASSACSCSNIFLIFFTEDNKGNEGAAALSIGFIFADFFGRWWSDGIAETSFVLFVAFCQISFFEQEDAEV